MCQSELFKYSGTAEYKDKWEGSSGEKTSPKKIPLFPKSKGLEEDAFGKDGNAEYSLHG